MGLIWDVCSMGFKFSSMEMVDVDDNGKLVAFRLSIWHYKVALDDL